MIVLVRHGQTAANRSGRLQGRADPSLTDLGRAQAARAGAALRAERGARVVSSPLARARETAAIVGAACGRPVELDERLVELDYGAWDGRPMREVTAEEWARWQGDPGWAPPGGESLVEVGRRVASCCAELLDADVDGPTIAVSHVSPIKAAVAWALGVDDGVSWRMHLTLASITRVGGSARRPSLVSFGETGHLAGLDR